MNLRLILTIGLGICAFQLSAQEKSNAKFGKITPDDFKQKVYAIDSNANAVVIADIGSTKIVGNTKGWFSLEFDRYKRVHILNKNGYDAANVEIGLFTNGDAEESLNDLKAVSYNLENGVVVETKLDTKSGVFKDRINKHLVVKKFTLPNIKEGTIIEFKYQIHSDFTFNLQPWDFQGDYPCLWSEYNVALPEFYYYVTLKQGYQQFFIESHRDWTDMFNVSYDATAGATERAHFSAGVTDYKWVMKDVPALKEESYTSTIKNHISRIEFQLAEHRAPLTPKPVMQGWAQVAEELLKDEDFGYSLNKDNGWLNDVMPEATQKASTNIEKARNIFAYVRNNMTCTNRNSKYLEKKLKDVLKSRNGNEAEINLLLAAMLTKAGLQADPVMLSTRSHGYTNPFYPLMERYNYVITKVQIDNNEYFLDASRSQMGFGRLHYDAYNGGARIIDMNATPIAFSADSLNETKLSSVIVINDEKGNFSGSMTQSPGYYESYSLRNRIKEKGKDQYFNDVKKGIPGEIEIQNPNIDSLDKFDDPVNIKYDFTLKTDKEDILYLNPMLGEAWKENPFKSATRNYPVEMPYCIDETYLLRIDIPTGYTIDELPKSIMVRLNENNDGFFEYVLSSADNAISFRSRICLKRAYYAPEEYETLREFFNLVVKKQAEQIVFKKKK